MLPNAAYSEKQRGRRHYLKARQLGFTTYIAARFFIATITRPGTLACCVAHESDSAQRSLDRAALCGDLPQRLREGCLQTSRANVRQLVFPALDSQLRVESAADENCGRGFDHPKSALFGSGAVAWRCGSDARFIARILLRIAGAMVLDPRRTARPDVFLRRVATRR